MRTSSLPGTVSHSVVMDHQMEDFDPYAEPKLDFVQTQTPPALRLQGTPRPEETKSREEPQGIDPHLTLSYNGSLPIFLRDGG